MRSILNLNEKSIMLLRLEIGNESSDVPQDSNNCRLVKRRLSEVVESKGWTNVGRNVFLFLSDFFLPEFDFALIYISRMIDRERFHPWIINGSRLNLIRKTW